MTPLRIFILTDDIDYWLNLFNDNLSAYECKRGYTYCRIFSLFLRVYIQKNFKEDMRGLSFDKAIIDKKMSKDDYDRLTESLWHSRRLEYTDDKFEKI